VYGRLINAIQRFWIRNEIPPNLGQADQEEKNSRQHKQGADYPGAPFPPTRDQRFVIGAVLLKAKGCAAVKAIFTDLIANNGANDNKNDTDDENLMLMLSHIKGV